jgi:hypothetical protein
LCRGEVDGDRGDFLRLPSLPIGWRSTKVWRTFSIGSPLDAFSVAIQPSSDGEASRATN